MNTAANLLIILVFLAAFYTALGLFCGIAERLRELMLRPRQRRRMPRTARRRNPRRARATAGGGARVKRPLRTTVREGTA